MIAISNVEAKNLSLQREPFEGMSTVVIADSSDQAKNVSATKLDKPKNPRLFEET